jgi:serine/threonine protein kinase
MKLWNDYEGRIIADNYPLQKLLCPEGRSAFFSTTNGTGTLSTIRIIEAHFDESEILSRWKAVSAIKHPNLVDMRKFGQTTLDETPVLYALMEPTDISLAELLANRRLTDEEALQLAQSLVAAVQALHTAGLVHEHVVPENIYAVGETVKLRTDCVREAVSETDESPAGAAARRNRDVRDFAVVVLQALTGHRSLQGSATLLRPPFDRIVPYGINGTWGLEQMAAVIGKPNPPAATRPAPAAPVSSAKPPEKATTSTEAVPKSAATAPPPKPVQEGLNLSATPAPAQQRQSAPVANAVTTHSASSRSSTATEQPLRLVTRAVVPDVRHRIARPVTADPRRNRVFLTYGLVALFALVVLWYFMRSSPSEPAETHAPAQTPAHSVALPAANTAEIATRIAAEAATPLSSSPANASTSDDPHANWRVIAYTYNRQEQAQQKVTTLINRNPSLSPQVFSPTGHAPYLVAFGGPMTRDDAAALRLKAIASGMPDDTYIQNYKHPR